MKRMLLRASVLYLSHLLFDPGLVGQLVDGGPLLLLDLDVGAAEEVVLPGLPGLPVALQQGGHFRAQVLLSRLLRVRKLYKRR